MVQDKPALRKAPLIILLFRNGDSVLTGHRGQSISLSWRGCGRVKRVSGRRKSKKYKVSGETPPPPPPLASPASL